MVATLVTQREASALLMETPAPVLFIDTCIFLDVLRAPVREEIEASSAAVAQHLCGLAAANPRQLWLVTSETVRNEWLENVPNVNAEVEREILKLEKRRKHFVAAAKAATNVEYQYGQYEAALKLEVQLQAISRRLLDACVVIRPEGEHMIRAMDRVKKYLPPARRGKAEPKDCEIFEVFLGLVRGSRVAGFAEQCLFATSNTADYGKGNTTGIEAELLQVNAKLVTDLPWALASIQGRT